MEAKLKDFRTVVSIGNWQIEGGKKAKALTPAEISTALRKFADALDATPSLATSGVFDDGKGPVIFAKDISGVNRDPVEA